MNNSKKYEAGYLTKGLALYVASLIIRVLKKAYFP